MASKLWVIESLVKIMDQIESIHKIPCLPCLLTAFQLPCGNDFGGRMGVEGMSNSQRLQDCNLNYRLDCKSLDVVYLNRATFDDVALRTEILGLFSTHLVVLQSSVLQPQTLETWRYLTHTLRGAAAAVGALAAPVPQSTQERVALHGQLAAASQHFQSEAAHLLDASAA
jgi:hypothetical protein